MRRGQYRREVVERLARIESNLDKICRELAELVRQQKEPQPKATPETVPDEWVQKGIDNIMSYQAGKKREGES